MIPWHSVKPTRSQFAINQSLPILNDISQIVNKHDWEACAVPSLRHRGALWGVISLVALAVSGCAVILPGDAPALNHSYPARQNRAGGEFPEVSYATWREDEPSYRLFPGDQLDVALLAAPELARTVTVLPDGRISLPYIAPVMVADRTPQEAEAMLAAAFSPILLHPQVSVVVKTAGPLKVFVGGEVKTPGVYDMPGDINALQAVTMAGGFTTGAKPSQVVILRRASGGGAMMRTVDLSVHPARRVAQDLAPLRRFDVVYVPRSRVAEAGLFMQQYARDLLPVQFGYTISSRTALTTQ